MMDNKLPADAARRRSRYLEPAEAVVLAIPHREYLAQGWAGIIPLLRGGAGVVIDVKAVLPRSECPAGITLRRL
ncbi:MAG: hypothetical protein ACHBNF_13850 [Chromatiales bacterium]